MPSAFAQAAASRSESDEVYLYGIITAWTRLGAQRVDRHRRAERRIDAAGEAQHDAGKAVVVDIVAQAHHAAR